MNRYLDQSQIIKEEEIKYKSIKEEGIKTVYLCIYDQFKKHGWNFTFQPSH